MDEDFGMVNELTLLASNIKKGICVVLLWGGRDMQKKTHNMLFLMLDPRFKNLRLVSL
jgi:hypothetical protein